MKTTNTNENAIRLTLMAGDHLFSKCSAIAATIDSQGATPAALAKLEGVLVLYRANRSNLEALANNGEPVNGYHEAQLRFAAGL